MTLFAGILIFLLGLVLGGLLIWFVRQREIESIQRSQEQMEATFGNLSRTALEENIKTFFTVAESRFKELLKSSDYQLEEKRKLIDTSLKELRSQLENLTKETSALKGHVEESRLGITQLTDTTAKLNQILSGSQARGQWGEKMVEDILNFMGFMEGVNYLKQAQEGSGRPDFTFILPRGKRINMDVKFPWSHYAALFEADSEDSREQEKKQFLADVKKHVQTIARREYIDPSSGTVDYVLMFIPNEGIYAYLNREGDGLVDFALENKVVLCSPITLYAVLSMIRQAVENFRMETRAGEIQALVQAFKAQWLKFVDKIDALGKSLGTVQKHYDELKTTRVRQLEKPVEEILDLQLGEAEKPPKLEDNNR
jgi:DNA recombination protein RmuC